MRTAVATSVLPRLGAVLALLVAVSACGGVAGPPEERLAAARAATASEQTAKVSIETRVELGEEGGSRMEQTQITEGEVDFGADQAYLTSEIAGLGQAIEVIFDAGVVYVRSPGFGTDAGEWVRSETDSTVASAFGSLGFGTSGNPAETLELLGAVSGEVTELGPQDVRGVPTLGYAFDGDLGAIHGEDAAGLDQVLIEVWLDDVGRVRRISYTVDLSELMRAAEQAGEQAMPEGLGTFAGTIATTIDYYDFGEPVDITLPPPDQVREDGPMFGETEGFVTTPQPLEPGQTAPTVPAAGVTASPTDPEG